MNDNELKLNYTIPNITTQLLQNIQSGAEGQGRVAPHMTTISTLPPITSPNLPLNSGALEVHRRAIPTQYAIFTNKDAYSGAFYNYPYSGMTNMSVPKKRQFHNPIVIAAAENSRPAFESIQSVVQSFNSVCMMLESTLTAMKMFFQAFLGVAENFTRLRMLMMKLHSTIVSFKLGHWFLTKLFYLFKMVGGDTLSNTEEVMWTALSSADNHKKINPSEGQYWPLVVFTGFLVTTPYLVYKLLNSVTPESITSVNNTLPSNMSIAIAQCDWSSTDPKTIPLVKGKSYLTSQENIASARRTGWLLVDNFDKKQGYAPLKFFKAHNIDNRSLESQVQKLPNVISYPAPYNEQMQPQSSIPVTDVQGNPIAHPFGRL